VILPKDLAKMLPKGKLLSDAEWRAYGVQQSRGWEHYAIHKPEQHILLFRRALGTDPTTGRVSGAACACAVSGGLGVCRSRGGGHPKDRPTRNAAASAQPSSAGITLPPSSRCCLLLQINHALKESALEAYNREYGLDGKK
jgi:cyclin-dependent kinase regulatory subunit CKS1